MGAHIAARLTLFDGLLCANASTASLRQSALSRRKLTTAICVQTTGRYLPAKDEHVHSVKYSTISAVVYACTVPLRVDK